MQKKVLFGVVFLASMILILLGFVNVTKAWTDITGTMSGSSVSDLLYASDGSIYASGTYNDGGAAKVWRYTGGAWTDITSGDLIGSSAECLIQTIDGSIYAGGIYNGFHARVWKYSNNTWTNFTGDIDGYMINSLIIASDGSIYAGGNHTEDNVDFFARVWKYSNNAWTDITGALTGAQIYSLVQAADGSIYAGGEYSINARVWKYSNNVWTDISGNLSGDLVYTLVQGSDGLIYAGGFYSNGISNYGNVWKYNGSAWQDTGFVTNSNAHVYDLKILGNRIYASGDELASESNYAAKVWIYSNNAWTSETLGTSDDYHTSVRTLLFDFNGLFVGGDLNSLAKAWTRDYTNAEWLLIEEYNLENGYQVILDPVLDGKAISGQELDIYFKDLPNKLTKNSAYWMQWQKYNAYPKKWTDKKKTALKRYWKLTTNLNKYKAKKPTQKFKIKVTFKYTKSLLNKLKKKNSLASKSNLVLKYRKKTTSWKELTSVFTDAKVVKKNKKMIVKYFTHFPKKTQYFAIGLK